MTTYGTPETFTQRCGDEIARLRALRNWSRARLINRLCDELDEDDPNYDSISESWLKRLEGGVKVKLPRQTLEALGRALRCTPRERARLLLYADRSVLTRNDDRAPDGVAEAINYTMACLYAEAHEILEDLIGQRRAADLDEGEIVELTAIALDLVIKQRRKRDRL
jgi:Helix-turn-helix domain